MQLRFEVAKNGAAEINSSQPQVFVVEKLNSDNKHPSVVDLRQPQVDFRPQACRIPGYLTAPLHPTLSHIV